MAILPLAFLVGSIPFGIVLARAFGLPDPRTIGSKNIGATNMLRTGRKDVALLTLLLDGLKGASAVWISHALCGTDTTAATLAVMMAVMGHVYSPWLSFKGGKGMATLLGGTLALSPVIGGMSCTIWLLVFVATGFSSLSAITALLAMPVLAHWVFDERSVIALAMTAVLVLYKHHPNISRLIKGEEPRFFKRKQKQRRKS